MFSAASNVVPLIVLLVLAAAAVVFTLVFVALADRSLSEGVGSSSTGSRRHREPSKDDGNDSDGDVTGEREG